MNKGTTGLLTELKAQQLLIEMGASVLTPIGAETPFDLVVHLNGKFSRVQIKTGWRTPHNSIRFQSYKGAQRQGLTSDDCEVLMVYCRDADTFYIVAPSGRTEGNIPAKGHEEFKFTTIGQLFPEALIPPKRTPGVTYSKRMDRWVVKLFHQGKHVSYGSYLTYEDAVTVAIEARKRLKNSQDNEEESERLRLPESRSTNLSHCFLWWAAQGLNL